MEPQQSIRKAEDAWFREPALRAYLQVSASTLKRLRTRGLPCIGRARLRRYHLETVLQWLSADA